MAVVAPKVVALSPEELDRYRNTACFQKLIPFTLRNVLEKMTSDKDKNESFMKYFNETLQITEEELKTGFKIHPNDIKLLHSTESSAFDAPLLFSLIRASNKNSKISCKLLGLLQKAINIRNAICHKIHSEGANPQQYKNAKKILIDIVKTSGSDFNQPQPVIENEIRELNKLIADIDQGNREDFIDAIAMRFCEISKKETAEKWSKYCSSFPIPSSDLTVPVDVYTPLSVCREKKPCDIKDESSDLNNELLTIGDESALVKCKAQVVILCGDAGCGKSSMLRNIGRHYLRLSDESQELVSSLSEINIMYYFECRNNAYCKFHQYLSEGLPEAVKCLSKELLCEASSHVRNSLALVDGYDEKNENSEDLLKSTMTALKASNNEFKIIIATRTHSVENLTTLVLSVGLDFERFNILDIGNEESQRKFLQKYEKEKGFPSDITVKFDRLPRVVVSYFRTPQLLSWFSYLCLSNYTEVAQWSTVADVIASTLTFYTKSIQTKLQLYVKKNLNYTATRLIDVIAKSAFEFLARGKITLNERDMFKLTALCLNVCPDVEVEALLSCVLIYKTNPNGNTVHEFVHKSHQEAFSALALRNELQESSSKSVEEVIYDLCQISGQRILQK